MRPDEVYLESIRVLVGGDEHVQQVVQVFLLRFFRMQINRRFQRTQGFLLLIVFEEILQITLYQNSKETFYFLNTLLLSD